MTGELDPMGAIQKLDNQLLKATEIYEGASRRDKDGRYLGDDKDSQNKRNGAIYAVASVIQALDGMGFSDRHKKALQGLLGALDDANVGLLPEMFESDIKKAPRRKPNLVLARHTSAACLVLIYQRMGMTKEEAASKVSDLLTLNKIPHPGKRDTEGTRAIKNFIKERNSENPTTLADKYYAAKMLVIDEYDLETAELIFLNDIRQGI